MSTRIRILPPSVAERIAAGEVVERPSSVVKELVENALDAGATEVVVALEDGGKARIEILDNGFGMEPADLALALERHATSKVRDLADLDRILTLGFRGEALPSIAAVADLSITSRPRVSADAAEPDAYEIHASQPQDRARTEPSRAKPVTFGHFLGRPHGTRVVVQNLFSQVPARLKFLKSAASEVSQIRELLERIALSKPETGFRLVHGDRTVLALRPQTEAERIRTLFADDEDFPLLMKEETRGALRVRAYWLQGLSTPQMKKLLQVVNGRTLKDRLLQQAMLTSFRQTLLPGQFPAAALFLELDPAHLDVNVHPTKTEVRFLESSAVFRAVSGAFESLLRDHGMVGFAAGSAAPLAFGRGAPLTPAFGSPGEASGGLSAHDASAMLLHRPDSQTSLGMSLPFAPSASTGQPEETSSLFPAGAPTRDALAEALMASPYVGTLFQTYLLFDLGEELGVVDQHAAHERIRFESLQRRLRGGEILPSQRLLTPENVPFDGERRADLEARLPWLEGLGFEVELFGEDRVLFRGVPPEWGLQDLKMRLHNLLLRAMDAETPEGDWMVDEALFEKLASEACHSSVRAGDRLERSEALGLVEALFRTRHPWNCPHGRPTLVRVPRARLEEWFQRRVPQ